MSKRTRRDGCPCDRLSYLCYGELDVPKDIIERKAILKGDNAIIITTRCPWYEAWKIANHIEYGKIFCNVFDEALARGYGEEVDMIVPVTLTHGNGKCEFIFKGSKFTDKEIIEVSQRKEKLGKTATKPFIYHMGHLYWTFSNALIKEYGYRGQNIITKALNDYKVYFVESIVEDIKKAAENDFTSI